MNTQHMFIHNACYSAVLETKGLDSFKRRVLLELLEKFRNVKPTNIYKFGKTLGTFEKEFINAGGDHDKLMKSIKEIRDQSYAQAVKATGLKIEKVK